MNDLQVIRETLEAPPPSARATLQARNRLVTAIEDPQSARPRLWMRSSLRWSLSGAVALAGIAAVGVATIRPQPTPTPAPVPGQVERTAPEAGATPDATKAPKQLSAQDILLAAAHQAATDETGRYWHVRRVFVAGPYKVGTASNRYDVIGRTVEDHWVARDADDSSWNAFRSLGFGPRTDADQRAWRDAGSPRSWVLRTDSASGSRTLSTKAGKTEWSSNPSNSYLEDIGGLDFDEVQNLPTDPEKLRDLIVARIAADEPGLPSHSWGARIRLFGTTAELLLNVPAPPQVRAAAFEVLADIPGVRTTGRATDAEGREGLGIELSHTSAGVVQSHQLVLDPRTHLILAHNVGNYLSGKGKPRVLKEYKEVIRATEWTDELPRRSNS